MESKIFGIAKPTEAIPEEALNFYEQISGQTNVSLIRTYLRNLNEELSSGQWFQEAYTKYVLPNNAKKKSIFLEPARLA